MSPTRKAWSRQALTLVVALVLASGAARAATLQDALAAARRGQYDSARTILESIVQTEPQNGEARLELGRLLETLGRRQEARAQFAALVQDYNTRSPVDAPSLTWAGAAGARTGGPHQAIRILELAQKADPSYARAFVEAGRLFAEKYQTVDAERELEQALALEPDNVDALVGLATVAFGNYEFQKMKAFLARIAALDPSRVEPHCLAARVLLLEEETFQQARAELDAALALNRRHPEALALAAAQAHLAGDSTRFKDLTGRALEVHASHAGAFCETAEILRRRRRLPEAEALFRKALSLNPEDVPTLVGLGQLLLATGREVEGREVLEKAHELDAFRVPVVNLLKTLDLMDDEFVYEGKGEVLVRYHPWRDPALEGRLADFAHASLRELAAAPGFSEAGLRPATSVLVEVLPEHRWFSARLVGVPWNGPVGACQGNLVVLDSPREVSGTMSWRLVLHHELAHAHHLAATGSQVPHWLTEGLAVFQEGSLRPAVWDRLLARALKMGELFELRSLNRGFVSPRNPGDWSLAYCQAELAIEHLVARRGPQTPGLLLAACARGARGDELIRSALGIEPTRLASEVGAFWRREAEQVPVAPVYYPGDVAALQKRWDETHAPSDAAELARAMLQGGDAAACRRILKQALAEDSKHPAALAVTGRLLLALHEDARALRALEQAAAKQTGPELLADLAEALVRNGRYEEAAETAGKALSGYGRDDAPCRVRAEAAKKTNNPKALLASLEDWERVNPAAVDCAVGRARLELDAGRAARALEVLARAVELDPGHPDVCELRGQALESLGRHGEARRAFRDLHAAQLVASVDGTPPATVVMELAGRAKKGDGPRAQGAADLLGLLADDASRQQLEHLAASATGQLAHRLALARGRRGVAAAVPGLLESLDCAACASEATHVLAGLTARPAQSAPAGWQTWWRSHNSSEPTRWLEEAVQPLGYPLGGTAGKPRLAVLLLALDEPRWYVRVAALAELRRLTGKSFGQGCFGPAGDTEPALMRARKEAVERWKVWVREKG